jgi:hypothetical protein
MESDSEVEYVGESNTHRFIHARPDCPEEGFRERGSGERYSLVHDINVRHCDKCFCFICEIPAAECKDWCSSTSSNASSPEFNHCSASYVDSKDAHRTHANRRWHVQCLRLREERRAEEQRRRVQQERDEETQQQRRVQQEAGDELERRRVEQQRRRAQRNAEQMARFDAGRSDRFEAYRLRHQPDWQNMEVYYHFLQSFDREEAVFRSWVEQPVDSSDDSDDSDD